MEQTPIRIVPEASTDERASSFPAFASPAEQAAFWAGIGAGLGLAHGVRAGPPADPLRANQSQAHPPPAGADILDFEAARLRYRVDGWTPERQRDYVEALADTGVARQAAALVGMTEQSVARLRRRADARGFDLACEAAQRIGARRILSVAVERAIEGTVKRHYYHGELKSEERVYDNRLLAFLIGKLGPALEPRGESGAVEAAWEPFVGAIGRGEQPPELPGADAAQAGSEAAGEAAGEAAANDDDPVDLPYTGTDIWEDEDGVWTSYPPPADYEGEEVGCFGEEGYRRRLTAAEWAVTEEDSARFKERMIARACADRDRYFGFEAGFKSPGEAEPYQPSAPRRRKRARRTALRQAQG